MTTSRFGPQNSNAALALPVGTTRNRYGVAQQTWVKDCSATGSNDGTILDAAFYNRIIGNLEYAITSSGVAAVQGDFTALWRAIQASAIFTGAQGVNVSGNVATLSVGTGVLPVLV